MNTVATLLVIGSAFMHATWNLLAKRSQDTYAFLWTISLVTLPIYAIPFAVSIWYHPIPAIGWAFILATGTIHCGYFTFLSQAYEHGALSVAYPLSRGTGVTLVAILAMPILGEHISPTGGAGIGLIVIGLITLHWRTLTELVRWQASDGEASMPKQERRGVLFALLTGCTICGYSLVDKAAVSHVFPVVYGYFIFVCLAIGLAPYMLLRRRDQVEREWRENRRAVLIGGVFVLGTYLIILGAMRLAEVAYIVPLREVSVLIGAAYGIWLLGEGFARQRLAGAGLILAGVLLIGIFA